MEDLNIGDIVILKSDRTTLPLEMTVSEINPDEVECTWRDGTNFRKMDFSTATLKKIG